MTTPTSLAVLYLTTEFPFPAHSGGRARSLAQLRLLSGLPSICNLHIQTLHEGDTSPAHGAALRAQIPGATVHEPIFHPIHLRAHPKAIPRMLWARAQGAPYLAAKWQSPRIESAIRQHGQKHQIDVIYIDHLGLAQYLPLLRATFPRAAVVLEQHNVESDFFQQFSKECKLRFRLIAREEARVARNFEARVLQQVDAVVAISDEDAAAFHTLANVKAITVPLRVDVETMHATPVLDEVLYVGNLGWRPNALGLDWFFQEVWPRARALNPKLSLHLVGSGLAKDSHGEAIVPAAWRAPGVTVHGYVEDLSARYASASALIAPVVGGSGVRIKLLHAMAAGVPVVTTLDGAAGLPVKSSVELEIGISAEDFAHKLCHIAQTPQAGRERRERAFDFLRAHHSKAKCEARLQESLDTALHTRAQRSAREKHHGRQ